MIVTSSLTKKFDNVTALENVSCTIQNGCIYGMVGSNGAGKSTFLRTISGVYKPDGGVALVDGENIYENPSAKARIAYVPDELYFISGANLNRMGKMYASLYSTFDWNTFSSLAKELDLPTNRGINTFSKGMRRQAITILALATMPEYIFFDETFDGLDPIVRNYMKRLICQNVVDRGATAIITSHSLRELEDTCDQLALLHKGGLILESDVMNLKTTQYKIQIAFDHEYDRSKFEELEIIHFKKQGSVSNMIVKGDRDRTIAYLSSMNPILMDILPLTLEEVFTYEMETLGYSFDIK